MYGHADFQGTTGLGMLTDQYELSMVSSSLRSGHASTSCVFEVFTRHLPIGRRYGVVCGTARLLDAIDAFRFTDDDIAWLVEHRVIDGPTVEFLRGYRFSGQVEGYPEGEVYFPYSPILTVRGSFAECVVLETLVLSILNHDCAVAAAAARMVTAAGGRSLIEMGSRRTNEMAATAAARAAHLAGFDATSNLAAGRLYGIPTTGTASHASVLLYSNETDAFHAQVAALGPGTTLLVDTYDISRGIEHAVEVAGPALGAIRIDSGDLVVMARQARGQLDRLGNTGTRIVVSGDLDEHSIAALAAAPVDVYGAGTAVALGSGEPTASLVYKMVEADGRAVAKRSDRKASYGGPKTGHRAYRSSGTATDEVVVVGPARHQDASAERAAREHFELRRVTESLMVDGERTAAGAADLDHGRRRLAACLTTLPWEGLSLSRGEPALPTQFVVEAAGGMLDA